MALAVALRIARYAANGGPTEEDVRRAALAAESALERDGEYLLCVRGPDGKTAEAFNRVADVVAVLAFRPDGVDFWGTHHEGATPRQR